jgi:hypothetical protein
VNLSDIQSVEGAELGGGEHNPNPVNIWIQIPPSDSEPYPHVKVVIHFSTGQKKGKPAKH